MPFDSMKHMRRFSAKDQRKPWRISGASGSPASCIKYNSLYALPTGSRTDPSARPGSDPSGTTSAARPGHYSALRAIGRHWSNVRLEDEHVKIVDAAQCASMRGRTVGPIQAAEAAASGGMAMERIAASCGSPQQRLQAGIDILHAALPRQWRLVGSDDELRPVSLPVSNTNILPAALLRRAQAAS